LIYWFRLFRDDATISYIYFDAYYSHIARWLRYWFQDVEIAYLFFVNESFPISFHI
jgi:hypothetical protein